ncbi:MAG TPA: glycosyltransferase family 2 protein [Candidatus Saccharimonadales bacterium]|nr:glycosyltransferase family 2 protein [Candidatus Saccharimonadales bacterium]
MVQLTISILSYNTPDLIISCLESLIEVFTKELEEGSIEILVSDNASEKETVETLKKFSKEYQHLKSLRFIFNRENLGFGKGHNMAAQEAKGAFLLFLNSDTLIKDKGFLEMVQYLKDHQHVGILGAKLLNSDGSAQKSAVKFYTLFNAILMLSGFERLGFLRSSPEKISKVDWVSGACMMIGREFFKKIGGFDEHIFMYSEDMEICYRAKMHGFSTYFFPQAKVMHKEHASSSRQFAILHIYEGLLYFYKKHKRRQYGIMHMLLKIKAVVAIVIATLFGRTKVRQTYQKALWM